MFVETVYLVFFQYKNIFLIYLTFDSLQYTLGLPSEQSSRKYPQTVILIQKL